MKYLDITQKISNRMKTYYSDPKVKIERCKSLWKGDSCNLYKLTLGTHSGTHIEAPYHMFKKGYTLDNIRIDDLICDVIVVKLKKSFNNEFVKKISRKDVKGVLFKKEKGISVLNAEKARILLKNKIKLVGTEGMTIESSSDKTHPVHRMLLRKRVIIIENINLNKAKEGYYKLIVLPLNIEKGDAAPARAILVCK